MENTKARAAGTPTWIDYWTADIDGTVAFFQKVFGWDVTEGEAQYGGYRLASIDGKAVGGFGPQFPPLGRDVQFVSLATPSVQHTHDAALAAGGAAAMAGTDHEIMDLGDNGLLVTLHDDEGNLFGGWQARQQKGFEITDVPGAPTWHELRVKNLPLAKAFYTAVFGVTYSPAMPTHGLAANEYVIALDGEQGLFGVCDTADHPGWISYYCSADLDATDQAVQAAGGSVVEAPHEFAYGKTAVYLTPGGARFGVFEPGQQGEQQS